MNIQQVLDLLAAANVCSGNIFRNVAPKGIPLPHGRYSIIETPLSRDIKSETAYKIRFNLSIWGSSFTELDPIKNLIRQTLNPFGREILTTTNKEKETGYIRLETNWYFTEV